MPCSSNLSALLRQKLKSSISAWPSFSLREGYPFFRTKEKNTNMALVCHCSSRKFLRCSDSSHRLLTGHAIPLSIPSTPGQGISSRDAAGSVQNINYSRIAGRKFTFSCVWFSHFCLALNHVITIRNSPTNICGPAKAWPRDFSTTFLYKTEADSLLRKT